MNPVIDYIKTNVINDKIIVSLLLVFYLIFAICIIHYISKCKAKIQ